MRIVVLITFFVTAALMSASGQIRIDSVPECLPLVHHSGVQATLSDPEARFNAVKAQTNWEPYLPAHAAAMDTAIWITFTIENPSEDTLKIYLHSLYDYTTVYRQSDTGYVKLDNGYYVPLRQRSNTSEYYFTKLELVPDRQARIYVRTQSRHLSASAPALFSEKAYLDYSRNNYSAQVHSIVFIYFYIFSLLTILIFASIFWLRVRNKLYLYYLGYLSFLVIYGFIVLRKTLAPVGNLFQYAPELSNKLNEPVQFVFITFYIFFIRHLLQVNSYDKRLARILYNLGVSCLIYAICHFLFRDFFNEHQWTEMVFNGARLIILPINLVLIIWIIWKVKHPLLGYFILGQSFFFIGAVLGFYINYSGMEYMENHFFGFKEAPNIVFQTGLLLEVYCFSLALGKNVSLIQKAKARADAALIRQLQENERLQVNMTRELDVKIREKTTELLQLYGEIEKERAEKIKNEFTQKINETEMAALRSQMNPHFIFNSMNAIKYLIMTSRDADAVVYLDSFSSLLRKILQNSNYREVTVQEELEILELYLSLEKNRIGTDFNYSINVPSKEALSQYLIPPLLLQPIVENALWHGLLPSPKTEKKLKITFDLKDQLKIVIEDNGIGRAESTKTKKLHTAMGTTIIRNRLALHNHLSDHAILLDITDLTANGWATGTRVTLTYQMGQ